MKLFILAVLLCVAAWGVNYFADTDLSGAARHVNTPQMNALAKAGDECVAIAEKATAHLIPKLEFQRLELAGRKANVVVRCMADHGFYQNPAWLRYAEPIATGMASEQHISADEATENLKRTDMLVFETRPGKPVYWQYSKKTDQ